MVCSLLIFSGLILSAVSTPPRENFGKQGIKFRQLITGTKFPDILQVIEHLQFHGFLRSGRLIGHQVNHRIGKITRSQFFKLLVFGCPHSIKHFPYIFLVTGT